MTWQDLNKEGRIPRDDSLQVAGPSCLQPLPAYQCIAAAGVPLQFLPGLSETWFSKKGKMMRFQSVFLLLLTALLLGGCAVGQALKNNVQGHHYLKTKNYDAGEDVFREAVARDGNNARSNYYLGRFLLAGKKTDQALPYLQKAASLDPEDPDYLFWLGVAQGELGLLAQERNNYERVLEIEEKHLRALIYLGHNLLKSGNYEAALETYQKVLAVWPYSPSALYNRALIAKALKRTPEEKIGWLTYLSFYPSGALAVKAADHLNRLEDFTYRNQYIGARTITLTKIRFQPFESELAPTAKPSLDVVGATVVNMGKGKLQVVVYQEENLQLARARAVSIKQYLLEEFPELAERGIGISWFSQPESLVIEGKKLKNPESVRFFVTDLPPTIRAVKRKVRPGRN